MRNIYDKTNNTHTHKKRLNLIRRSHMYVYIIWIFFNTYFIGSRNLNCAICWWKIWINEILEEFRLSYRFAHLLLPLQHIGNGMVTGKLDMTIKNYALAKYGCDMYCILLTCKTSNKIIKIKFNYGWKYRILRYIYIIQSPYIQTSILLTNIN